MLYADTIGRRLAIGWTMGTVVSAMGVYSVAATRSADRRDHRVHVRAGADSHGHRPSAVPPGARGRPDDRLARLDENATTQHGRTQMTGMIATSHGQTLCDLGVPCVTRRALHYTSHIVNCRSCGTEIADKALICYRCGTATTEAKFKPAAVRAARRASLIVERDRDRRARPRRALSRPDGDRRHARVSTVGSPWRPAVAHRRHPRLPAATETMSRQAVISRC